MLTETTPAPRLADLQAEREEVEQEVQQLRRWAATLARIRARSDEALAEAEHRLTWLDGAIHALEEQAEATNQH